MELRADLLRLVPDERRVTTSESVLDQHAQDLSYHRPRRPDAVVYAKTTEEVAALLRWASEQGVPVVPFGAGTSLEGHVIPARGGISLDLTRMDRIVELRPHDLLAVVQAGVLRSALNAAAGEHGLQFPVDPGADATLGGMAATNASGTTTVRYGGMRTNVLALEAVLADGRVVRAGSRAAKTSAGYDLRSLFVGSEGTLGVITELTLRLHGIPEAVVGVRAAFADLDAACAAAVALVGSGLSVARLELLDALTIAAVNAYKGMAYAEAPSLFLELAGSEAGVGGDVEAARELCEGEGCLAWAAERDPTARARLWEARHHVLFALVHGSPGKLHKSTDVCVPVSELPGAVRRARLLAEDSGLAASIIAHAGDGNYHVLLMLDPADPAELAAAERLNDALVEHALAVGGTCTGEHGIGQGKIGYLEREHGDLLPLMRDVKRAFDPQGILNPGKVVASEAALR
ncbi:MAG: FAD-binding protein [Thermoleophilia bacterium]|nr:FAD-binding protein [Thermoleophilia bacterium]